MRSQTSAFVSPRKVLTERADKSSASRLKPTIFGRPELPDVKKADQPGRVVGVPRHPFIDPSALQG